MPSTLHQDSGSNRRPEKSSAKALYIVSPNTLQAQLIKSCLDNELGFPSYTCRELAPQNLIDPSNDRKCIYLIDCLNFKADDIKNQFEKGIAAVPGDMMAALYNIDANCRLAPVIKQYKIRGIFYREDSQSIFIKGMKAILNGALWLSRKTLSECILMPGEAIKTPHTLELSQLSLRQIEILRHVHTGESNQEIADALGLSLHTVKTHLYNIYKKINVSNRLQATLWAATFLMDDVHGSNLPP